MLPICPLGVMSAAALTLRRGDPLWPPDLMSGRQRDRNWNGTTYVWVRGYWGLRPYPGYVWLYSGWELPPQPLCLRAGSLGAPGTPAGPLCPPDPPGAAREHLPHNPPAPGAARPAVPASGTSGPTGPLRPVVQAAAPGDAGAALRP